MATTEILQRTRTRATCSSCQAPIVFAQNAKTLKVMPFDAPLTPISVHEQEGGRMIEVVDLRASHFVSCPHAQRHRRAR